MTESSTGPAEARFFQQSDFEKISKIVSTEFQVENALVELNIPTFHLKQPEETKHAFLRLLSNLESMNLIAFLRRIDGKIILKVVPKPPVKKTNVLINWLLFFATIGTTFLTGYLLSDGITDAYLGGAAFTVAIMAVLGMHEMSHKLSANRHKIEATSPYFIPGPPPLAGFLGIGTFGAVIMQKSLPPNRDALYDVGSSGPMIGFAIAFIVSLVGLKLSPLGVPSGNENFLPVPLIFEIFALSFINIPSNLVLRLHPVAVAGWAGMVVTMLNLLPAAMLDGGHVARAVFGEKTASMLTWLSIIYLVFSGFWPMAFFVLFISRSRHPGSLDEVSGLSIGRKVLSILLLVILVLCSFPPQPIF